MASEFKAFMMRGNVIDLAVGVVIGAAFGKIVSALVDKVVMPPIGLALGGVTFSDLAITLKEGSADGSVPPVLIEYGAFLQTLIDFAIIAAAIFLLVKAVNRVYRREAAAPPAPAPEVVLLTEIRDALKAQPPR
jgi:large conductance mechanosensitive channel